MKYSYNWLKELSGTKKSPEKMVEDLTFHSFEVESMEKSKGDAIIDIKVLPDRAHDAMSHVGVAREIAVLENKKFDYDYDGLRLPKIKAHKLKIEISDKKLCPRYIGAVMTNIEVKNSPEWMKKRLEASGIRAINNIVDATNYVMLELGQPLHAFDFEKISGKIPNSKFQIPSKLQITNYKLQKSIIVRRARNGEKIELLDGVVKGLTSDDLLITDGANPLAIAGIKGGKLAEIDENTKTVILESANFNAVNIRRTRTRLNLKTDSSDRFEKDLDPNLAEKAMVRLIEIIEHIAAGELEGLLDVYPNPVGPWKIKLNLDYVNNLLGGNVPAREMDKIFKTLGIKIKAGKIMECTIPTYRLDLRTQEDLTEEIGRIYGYEKIKEQPIISQTQPAKINEQVFFERKIQDVLTGLGFDEVYNYSFYGEKDANNCGLDGVKHLELENPMNPDQKFVRVSLVPNILKNVYDNFKNFEDFRIFEEGRCYWPGGKKIEEKRFLAMAVVKNKSNKGEIFYDLKGAVEDLFEALSIDGSSTPIMGVELPKIAHPGHSAEIKIAGEKIGVISEINPAVLSEYKIKSPVAMAEFDLEILKKYASKLKTYKPISKFPIVTRDISLLIANNTTYAQIIDLVKKTGGNLVRDIKLFDIFAKDSKKSLAFHIEFGKDDRTLENKKVDEAMKEIIDGLKKGLGLEIRK